MTGLFGAQTQSTPATANQFQNLPPEIQNLARTSALWQTGQVGKPADAYPYAIAAPLSANEAAAAPAAAGLAAGDLWLAGPTAGQVGATLSGAYLPQSDPYLQNIIAGLNLQRQRDTSALRSQYGNLGLANSEALARAESDLGTQYAAAEGNLQLNAYEQERARQAAMVPYGAALPQQAISSLLTTGGTVRQAQQNQLSAAYQDWLRQLQGMWQAIGMANPLVQLAYQPQPVTTTTAPSLFSQLLAGAAAAAEAGAFA